MNKLISKEIFLRKKIKTPNFLSINKLNLNKSKLKKEIKRNKIKFPIVLKPTNEGSSIGVKICKSSKKLMNSSKLLLKKYNELMIEEYIGGQEIQVAVINGHPLGAIELIPKDYFMIIKRNIQKRLIQNILCQQDFPKLNINKF